MRKYKSMLVIISAILTLMMSTTFVSAEVSLLADPETGNIIESYYDDFFVIDGGTDFSDTGRSYVLTGKTIISKNTDVGNKGIYLKSGSTLIIKNGASFSTNGSITIERGAKLYVTNGSLVCGDNSALHNYGRIIVREKGMLTVEQIYRSNGGSSVDLQGEMYLGGQSVSAIVKKIKKYDKKFNLNDYCISFFKKAELEPTFYYCVGDVKTDYYYKSSDSKTIKRKNYSLNKVYNAKTNKKIKDAAAEYLSDNGIADKFSDDMVYFEINYGFDYSYSKKELNYSETYAKYSPMDDGTFLMTENSNEKNVFVPREQKR